MSCTDLWNCLLHKYIANQLIGIAASRTTWSKKFVLRAETNYFSTALPTNFLSQPAEAFDKLVLGGRKVIDDPQFLPSMDELRNVVREETVDNLCALLQANEQLDLSKEETFRRTFESPFFFIIRASINRKLHDMCDKTVNIDFKTSYNLRRVRSGPGANQAIDGAIVLRFNQQNYLLGLVCCKKNHDELRRHDPYQGISYLLKTVHPDIGLEVSIFLFV